MQCLVVTAGVVESDRRLAVIGATAGLPRPSGGVHQGTEEGAAVHRGMGHGGRLAAADGLAALGYGDVESAVRLAVALVNRYEGLLAGVQGAVGGVAVLARGRLRKLALGFGQRRTRIATLDVKLGANARATIQCEALIADVIERVIAKEAGVLRRVAEGLGHEVVEILLVGREARAQAAQGEGRTHEDAVADTLRDDPGLGGVVRAGRLSSARESLLIITYFLHKET